MKTIRIALLTTGAIIGLAAVTLSAQTQNSIAKQLIGQWRNHYLKITINTFNNTAANNVTEADSSNWEAKLHIKPIRTYFKADASYYSEYRNLKDSIVRLASGTWTVKADTITMTQLKPDKSVIKLSVKLKKNTATFSGLIDFDGDGKTDDEYFGIQKKYQ